MRIRVFDVVTNETIFKGSVNSKRDSLDSVIRKAGKVDFANGLEKSFKAKSGKVYNYFNIVFEVI